MRTETAPSVVVTPDKPEADAAIPKSVSSPFVRVSRPSVAFNRKDGKPNSANQTNPSAGSTNTNKNHKLFTLGCRGGDMLALTTTFDGKAPYLSPLRTFCLDPNNQDVVVNKCAIHYVTWQRDAADPEKYKEDPQTKSGFYPRYTLFFSALGDKDAPDKRQLIGRNICAVNNNPTFQETHYSMTSKKDNRTIIPNKIMLEYTTDITPPNGDLPFLSDYLTIRDLLHLLSQLFRDEETLTERSYEDLWNNREILSNFFRKDLLPRVGKVINKLLHPDQATVQDLASSLDITPIQLEAEAEKTSPVNGKLVNPMSESGEPLRELTEEERADFRQMEQDQAEHDDPIMG